MDLDQQLQILIDQAPQDGKMPQVMAQAIVPVLKAFAQKLQFLEYYVCQSLEGDWLITTLAQQSDPQQTKTVIYGFSSLALAQQHQGSNADPSLIAVPLPVTHLLFQLFSLAAVDSLILTEAQGSLEIRRQDLQQAVQQQLLGDRPRQTPDSQWA
ncbi:hypothetical protein [Picosynechococcus sp. PCC 73109]|uniref:hypothetical protein n=1 Tax=Picosynechococcus sp. PCC 73109 TaxID=374982 RepID=UPI0007457E09|nr:hypothetical protein [Picosynechococcus sp. PCC 73109]AMA08500.1 hypothetical protein AWQ23_03740 [Picosynechococcus sp. PCC 73109]